MALRLGQAATALGSLGQRFSLSNATAAMGVVGASLSRRRGNNSDGSSSSSSSSNSNAGSLSCRQHGISSTARRCSSTTTSNVGLPVPLPFEKTKFNSATVDVSKIQVEDTADFALKLFSTVDLLRKSRKAAMWLKVPVDFCHYISVAAHYGFQFHHTQPKYVMMCLWMPEDVPNKVPPYGTHHLGVAGCVMNDNREVLLVKEKHRHAMWKFPGGLADPGEGIGEAAVREVLEETGVEADFRSVLSMRHQHDVQFGNSDLYFVCRLMLKEGGALDITKCSHEIADACWMPLDQFKKQTRHSMLAVVADMLEDPEAQELTRSLHNSAIPDRAPYFLYHRHTPP